jgi:transcriptional regulator PpsR
MSPSDLAWTSGLIPMIEPDEVTKIIARISDIALILSQDGRVLGVMPNPSFRGQYDLTAWEGQPLSDQMTIESVPKLARRLAELDKLGDTSQPLEVNHKASDAYDEFPMRYSFHRIGSDGALLLLGSDLRTTAEMQQQLVAAQIALEQDYEAQRDNNLKFRVLMSAMDEAFVYVSVRTGKILEASAAALTLLRPARSDLSGLLLAETVSTSVEPRDLIAQLVSSATQKEGSTLKAMATDLRKAIKIQPKIFRTSGEQMLLCKLMASASESVQTDDLRDNLVALFESGLDAIVFVGGDGTILSMNDAFLRLADIAHASTVRSKSIAEFLNRGTVDFNVILENAKRSGAMRLYATKIKSDLGADRAIEISTTRLSAGADAVYALIIRDASRLDANRSTNLQVSDVDMESVIEYIGNQSLKDIVATTTDVVEKMCIETAVKMTSNNRVAAAEMLGLSRQSLYVKLRKYGLVKRD